MLVTAGPDTHCTLSFKGAKRHALHTYLNSTTTSIPTCRLLSRNVHFRTHLTRSTYSFSVSCIFRISSYLRSFNVRRLTFSLRPTTCVRRFHERRFTHSGHDVLPLPTTLNTVHLAGIRSRILRHRTRTCLTSHGRLLWSLLASVIFHVVLESKFPVNYKSRTVPAFN